MYPYTKRLPIESHETSSKEGLVDETDLTFQTQERFMYDILLFEDLGRITFPE